MPLYGGDGPFSVNIEDEAGLGSRVTPVRSLSTSPMVRLVGSSFHTDTKDYTFWNESVSGSADVSQSNGCVTLKTGLSASSYATYQTTRVARYVAGSANLFRGIFRLRETGSLGDGNVRRAGAYSATDGFFFQCSGSSFSVGSRVGGVDTLVVNGLFNGVHGRSVDLDDTIHVCEIVFTNSSAWYFFENKLLHKSTGTRVPLARTLSLPVTIENTNAGGGTADRGLEVRTCSILRLGEQRTDPRYFHMNTLTGSLLKVGPGQLHRVVINAKGNTTNEVVLYDGVSANVPMLGMIDATGGAATLDYQVPFQTGLYVVSRSGFSADVTVIYD